MRKVCLLSTGLVALGAVALLAQPAVGCWAMMPEDELVIQSDLVVVGELSDVQVVNATVSSATLTVKSRIKGPALKTVPFRFTSRAVTSATITLRGDEKAIFFLKKSADGKSYSIFYPSLTRTEKMSAKKLAAKVASLRKLVKQTAPKDVTLAKAITATAESQGRSHVFNISAAFKKEVKTHRFWDKRAGKERVSKSDSWFLVDGKEVKVQVVPGRFLEAARTSAANGGKLSLKVRAKSYGAGESLTVQMFVMDHLSEKKRAAAQSARKLGALEFTRAENHVEKKIFSLEGVPEHLIERHVPQPDDE